MPLFPPGLRPRPPVPRFVFFVCQRHDLAACFDTPLQYAGGVPYEALDALGAFQQPLADDSFYSFLRRLPPEQGVKLQAWRRHKVPAWPDLRGWRAPAWLSAMWRQLGVAAVGAAAARSCPCGCPTADLRQYCTLSLPCAQWWLSSWELHGFARQYASLAVQQGLRFVPLRFEARPCPAPTSGGPCVFSMLKRDGTIPAALNASQHQRCVRCCRRRTCKPPSTPRRGACWRRLRSACPSWMWSGCWGRCRWGIRAGRVGQAGAMEGGLL